MIAITHTPATGITLEGTTRGDGTNQLLKPLGWRWSANIEVTWNHQYGQDLDGVIRRAGRHRRWWSCSGGRSSGDTNGSPSG